MKPGDFVIPNNIHAMPYTWAWIERGGINWQVLCRVAEGPYSATASAVVIAIPGFGRWNISKKYLIEAGEEVAI